MEIQNNFNHRLKQINLKLENKILPIKKLIRCYGQSMNNFGIKDNLQRFK